MNLVSIADLSREDVRHIFALAREASAAPADTTRRHLGGTVGWSFHGNGIRTRTTFIQGFHDLGLSYIELPNLLETDERPRDLAGYLDPFYCMYVIRAPDHERLSQFASASTRPVVNALSAREHPCEVLTDAFFADCRLGGIEGARIGLWGPPTNVFESWHRLASVLGFEVVHLCDRRFHRMVPNVRFRHVADVTLDLLVTDGWPDDGADLRWSLTVDHLARLGGPCLIPTPPFSIGRELGFDPCACPEFAGYDQKRLLLPVQRAILTHLLLGESKH